MRHSRHHCNRPEKTPACNLCKNPQWGWLPTEQSVNPWIGRNPESWRRSRGSNMMSGQFCPHCLSEIRGLLLEELCFPKTTVNLEGKEMQKSSASCRNKLLLEIARPLTQNHVDCLLCHCLFTHCRHILFSLGTRPPAHLLQLIESFSCLPFSSSWRRSPAQHGTHHQNSL